MAQNRFTNHTIQPNLSMSSSHSITAAGAALNTIPAAPDDEDDNDDICPVCDGVCTCDNRPRPVVNQNTTRSSHDSYMPSSSTSQSLKIKLIVPPATKNRNNTNKRSNHVVGDNASASTSSQALLPSVYENVKQRRRQAKNVSSAEESSTAASTPKSLLQKRKAALSKTNNNRKAAAAAKLAASRKNKAPAIKKTTISRTAVVAPPALSSESELTDLEDDGDEDDDARSGRFPTFLSASAMSSGTRSETSSSDADSGFDTDSSMEAEEEDHILSDENRKDKGRSRKDDDWVIRSRPQSVGLDEVDMDAEDSDATASADPAGYEHDDEEPMDEGRPAYEHIMTGWSEDEDDDSGADAEIFFANLGDSSGDSSSEEDNADVEDFNQLTDMDVQMSENPMSSSLDFDLTRDWAAVGFTEDDAHVAQLLFGDPNTVIQAPDLGLNEFDEEDEEDEDALEETDGSTTEEDLVDEHGLPTPRAMKLFKWPQAPSAINPLSTVSPSTSPSRGRSRKSSLITTAQNSPCPADILAGKVSYFGDSDEFDVDDSEIGPIRGRSRMGPPRMGHFARTASDPMAVLDGTNKDVPSPFPRSKHRKIVSESSTPFERGRRSSLSESVVTSPDLMSDEGATTTIELHDVLDASILEQSETADELDMSDSAHVHNMMRWNIPIGAFRDSRGKTVTVKSPNWQSSSPRVETSTSTPFGLKSSPFSMMWQNKQTPKGTRHRNRAPPMSSHAMGMSPVILPVADGDRSTFQILAPPSHNQQQQSHHQQLKSRKELRKELKSKRRSSQSHKQQRHPHHHTPNSKSRASSSIQRTNFFASGPVPPLNI